MKERIIRHAFIGIIAVVMYCSIPNNLVAQAVYTDANGIAIKGFDAVAYFTDMKPVQGNKEFLHQWNGATWYFVSADHRDMFKASPEKYAPQYGGYCAYGVCMKKAKFSTDPKTAWKIVDGKLYLNYNVETQTVWERGTLKETIENGDKNWKTLAPEKSK